MSGHSKWANIKQTKGKMDAQRGRIFTKIGKELAVAVKIGGADPVNNPRLRDSIAKAKANNMPNDNISRSIKKASGELGGGNFEEVIYEGYGMAGSALIVECLTDNRNRTAGDVRHIFDKFGGSLGSNGCVSFLFDKLGMIVLEKSDKFSDDDILEWALDCGAQDVIIEDVYQIVTTPEDFSKVKEYMQNKGLTFLSAEVELVPQSCVDLDEEKLEKFNRMLEMLEDNEDVQEVYHNVNLGE